MRTYTWLACLLIGSSVLTTATVGAAEFERAEWIAPPAGGGPEGARPPFPEGVVVRPPRRDHSNRRSRGVRVGGVDRATGWRGGDWRLPDIPEGVRPRPPAEPG